MQKSHAALSGSSHKLLWLCVGILIWIVNAAGLATRFRQMGLMEALGSGTCFLILPPVLWRDWSAHAGELRR